jgi:2-oxoglutarate ferredoxin oxidoreductase subunit alpha
LPGTDHPAAAYFARGSGHNEHAEYTERPADFVNLMDRLAKKMAVARDFVPEPVIEEDNGAKVGIIAYGTTHHAIGESRHQLMTEHGIAIDYLRIRALPLSPKVEPFIAGHERIYVVEQNRDGQMKSILTLEYPKLAARLRGVLHYSGIPIDARSVTNAIVAQEKEAK